MSEVIVEEWRPVVGYEGLYEVSSFGKVRSVTRVIRQEGYERTLIGKPLTLSLVKGYLRVTLSLKGRRYETHVHRLVLEAFVGPRPEGHQARHGPDRNPLNNNADNLKWGTAKQNAEDRDAHGTTAKGKTHWAQKYPLDYLNKVLKSAWEGTRRKHAIKKVKP